MGILINEVCCIDSSYLADTENENFRQGPYFDSLAKNNYKIISNFENNKYYHSSQLKPLPLNEIKYHNPKNIFSNEVKSLSKLPISTQNVIRRQSGNPLDYYDIIKKLGKGTFGTVYKVMHKNTGVVRAMKVIPKNNLRCGFTDEDIIQEINILKKLEHPHIIKIYEFYTFKKNYYLINEFCSDGDLSEKLSKLRIFPEFIVKILMIQVFNAVMYLNENCVIHGDLKLENIMIDSFLNANEITNRENKSNFIQSLLEDEKEINEYLRQSELKRSSTYHNFGNKKLNFQNKIKDNKNNHKKSDGENLENIDNKTKMRKRGNTSIKSSLFKNNLNITDNKEKKIIKEEIYPVKNVSHVKEQENAFDYLNGKNDDNDDDDYEKIDNTNNNIIINNNINKGNNFYNNGSNNDNIIFQNKSNENIENGCNKINNIKVYKENFFENQLKNEKYLKEDKENTDKLNEYAHKKINSQNLNCNIRKTLTLSSMKMKNFELKLIDLDVQKSFLNTKKISKIL